MFRKKTIGDSIRGGTPGYRPFLDGIFPDIDRPAIGAPPLMENPQMWIDVCSTNNHMHLYNMSAPRAAGSRAVLNPKGGLVHINTYQSQVKKYM